MVLQLQQYGPIQECTRLLSRKLLAHVRVFCGVPLFATATCTNLLSKENYGADREYRTNVYIKKETKKGQNG